MHTHLYPRGQQQAQGPKGPSQGFWNWNSEDRWQLPVVVSFAHHHHQVQMRSERRECEGETPAGPAQCERAATWALQYCLLV